MNPISSAAGLVALVVTCSLAGESPDAWALVRRGDDLNRRQQPELALRSFEEAEKIEPNRVEVMLRISKEYTDLMSIAKSPSEAEAYGRKALDYALRCVKLAPDNAKAHLSVAVCYGRLTDFVGGKTKLEYSRIIKESADRALKLDPTDDYTWHVLGRWNYGVANVSRVMKALAKIVYGGVPKASNEEAVKYFREAIRLAPDRVIHRSELARVYTALGQKDLAREQWETVLSLPPRDAHDKQEQIAARAALSGL